MIVDTESEGIDVKCECNKYHIKVKHARVKTKGAKMINYRTNDSNQKEWIYCL